MKDTLIVIPARYASTRLPGKMLEKIDGKSVMQWVWEACNKAQAGEVIIATESQIIVDEAAKFGAKAVITSDKCQSGTDRVYEVAKATDAKYIVNVQGDEPFVAPTTIKNTIERLKNCNADIVTACMPTLDLSSVSNPNHVKAVLNKEGRALYFSRSVIPYKRENTPESLKAPYYIHCGIYAFKRAALEKFVSLPKSNLENLEKLEQLRALEAGMTIESILIEKLGPAIDTIEDLYKAKEFAKQTK